MIRFFIPEVESTLKAGPMSGDHGSLEKYLHTMSRLKGALDYFEKNNPQSIELENVRTLYELGGDALGREFSEQIKKHSRSTNPVINSKAELQSGSMVSILAQTLQLWVRFPLFRRRF